MIAILATALLTAGLVAWMVSHVLEAQAKANIRREQKLWQEAQTGTVEDVQKYLNSVRSE